MARRIFSFLAIPSLTLASADEGANTVPTEKTTTEKGKRRIRREMLSQYEMSFVQTAVGMSAQRTTSEPLSRLSVARDRADRLFYGGK